MASKKAPIFKQVALKPGRYFNKRSGEYDILTAEEIRDYAAGTSKLIAAGYAPPGVLNHEPPESSLGKPKDRRQAKADELRNTFGWLRGMTVGNDGSAEFSFEVTDPDIAKKIQEGSLKFVSPELLKSWTDGKGVTHEKIVSHLALTNRPRNPNQSAPELAGAQQFSLEDWEPVQFADDTEDQEGEERFEPKEKSEKPEEPENPDIVKMGGGSGQKRKQNIEAMMVALEKLGLQLPADTNEADEEKLIDRLLTALLSVVKNEEKMATKEKETAATGQQGQPQSGQKPEVVEQRGVMQYSIEDLDNGKCPNKLLSKFIRQEHQGIVARVDALIKGGNVGPAVKKKLLTQDTLQFDADGELTKTFTLDEVVGLLEEITTPAGAWTPDEIAGQFAVEDHPDGDKHYRGDGAVSEEEAKAINDKMAKQMPGMFREPVKS